MSTGRNVMTSWVVQALKELGGEAGILDICKKVWASHEEEIRNAGDLFYEWQYEIRWAGNILRREGVLRSKQESPRHTWMLSCAVENQGQ